MPSCWGLNLQTYFHLFWNLQFHASALMIISKLVWNLLITASIFLLNRLISPAPLILISLWLLCLLWFCFLCLRSYCLLPSSHASLASLLSAPSSVTVYDFRQSSDSTLAAIHHWFSAFFSMSSSLRVHPSIPTSPPSPYLTTSLFSFFLSCHSSLPLFTPCIPGFFSSSLSQYYFVSVALFLPAVNIRLADSITNGQSRCIASYTWC